MIVNLPYQDDYALTHPKVNLRHFYRIKMNAPTEGSLPYQIDETVDISDGKLSNFLPYSKDAMS